MLSRLCTVYPGADKLNNIVKENNRPKLPNFGILSVNFKSSYTLKLPNPYLKLSADYLQHHIHSGGHILLNQYSKFLVLLHFY